MRALLLGVVVALGAASAAAQPVRVPGSRVSVAPPAGFEPAAAFAGFQNAAAGASLVVAEVPGAPLDEMRASLTPDALATQGVEVLETREVAVNGVPSVLLRGTQSAYGTDYTKWILVTGDSVGVVLVTAIVPTEAEETLTAAVEAALLTVTWAEAASEDLLEGLPFVFDVPAGLPDRQRLGAGLLMADGIGAGLPPGRPLLVVSMGAAPLASDLAPAAERRLAQIDGLREIGPARGRAVDLDGVGGYEVVAEAADAASGEPLTAYLVLAPAADGYVVLYGQVGASAADAWLPRFRAVAGSIRWHD